QPEHSALLLSRSQPSGPLHDQSKVFLQLRHGPNHYHVRNAAASSTKLKCCYNSRAWIAPLVCTAAVCSIVSGALLSFVRSEAPNQASQRVLTFAQRVAYQRAIEEVYWRHRIWPKENSKPKPSLDEVMSAQQIEKKIEDYLRDAQALEAFLQKPIAPEQLQAERERMAQNTKQPEVLREL